MNKTSAQTLTGTVSSAKMAKTVIVRVEQVKIHPKYQKRYKVTKNYAADTAGQEYAVGDKVEIVKTRPLSKTKHWRVVKKV